MRRMTLLVTLLLSVGGTVVAQTRTLNVGDVIVVGETFGKVRALENDEGKRVTKAGPSSAVVVLGLSAVPEAGGGT